MNLSVCPRCAHERVVWVDTGIYGDIYQCTIKKCRCTFSEGSWIEKHQAARKAAEEKERNKRMKSRR